MGRKSQTTMRNREDSVKQVALAEFQQVEMGVGWAGLLGHLALSSSSLSFYFLELCLPGEGTDQTQLA